jgi:hypothetical protein
MAPHAELGSAPVSALRRVVAAAVPAAALSLAATGGAGASSTATFTTPTHRIGCAYTASGGAPSLRCDVLDPAHPPARPDSCELDYGSAFGLQRTGRPARLCVGDTVVDPRARVLAYGKRRQLGPFTCLSRATGLRCTNGAGHGFTLSRQAQKLF